MFFLYSLALAFYFIGSLPHSIRRRENVFSGLRQKLGYLPDFKMDARPVLWLHCYSSDELESSRRFIEKLLIKFPSYRLVISTRTKAGQELARKLFADQSILILYFPFDWKFCVRRVLHKIKPNIVFITENEIWFNFIREAGKSGSRIFIINGKFSEKAFNRYRRFRETLRRVWRYIDEALMQSDEDAQRLLHLGMRSYKISVTGNIKLDQSLNESETLWIDYFQERFGVSKESPLIVAADTESPEEEKILEAFKEVCQRAPGNPPRLMLAPQSSERYDEVSRLIEKTGFNWVRRSETISRRDQTAAIILLDIPDDIYNVIPLAEMVFVGSNLTSHSRHCILEAAIAEKPVIINFDPKNCEPLMRSFIAENAVVQLSAADGKELSTKLAEAFLGFLEKSEKQEALVATAYEFVQKNRGAIEKTFQHLQPYLHVQSRQFIE